MRAIYRTPVKHHPSGCWPYWLQWSKQWGLAIKASGGVWGMALPRHFVTAAAMGLALVACACSSGRPSQGVLIPVAASAEGTSQVSVLAATTRRRSTTDPGEMFSGERGDEVSYAAVTVSIPPDSARKVGHVQWPSSPPGNPQRDFVTASAGYLDKRAFSAAISNAAKQSGRSRVLIFVHGFNNRFDDAVYRFAQIVHDSKAEGIPVLFTWPSRGEVRLSRMGMIGRARTIRAMRWSNSWIHWRPILR